MRFFVFTHNAERRDGLKALLRQIDRRASFCDAPDWRSATRALQHFSPHLFVMDWHSGIGTGKLRAFIDRHPWLPVVTLIDEVSPAIVQNLLREGARGIVSRMIDPRLIVVVFETVLLGGYHAPVDALLLPPPAATPAAAARLTAQPGHDTSLKAMPQRRQMTRGLSPRQEQIMRCVHMGSTNKTIARTLGISESTVKVHLASIFRYLGATNRAAAVAIYNGWLAAQLQVLQEEGGQIPRNMHGQPGPFPLRAHPGAWRYPPPVANPDTLPIAAEPSRPFGGTSGRPKRNASPRQPADDPLPPQQDHDNKGDDSEDLGHNQ
jgi:DNA-binding NarL/FixJ family response regulator